jgi:hypothetical protein
MRRWSSAAVLAGTLAWVAPALLAQAKPADATAQCQDGTYSTAKSKQGACSGHDGIKTWYADDKGAEGDAKAAAKSTKDAAASAGKATAGAAKVVGKGTKSGAEATGKATANATGTAATKTEEGATAAGNATAAAAGTAAGATKDATATAAKATGKAATATANALKPKPADAPQGATAKCKDGSYSTATEHRGACSDHGGVADYYK